MAPAKENDRAAKSSATRAVAPTTNAMNTSQSQPCLPTTTKVDDWSDPTIPATSVRWSGVVPKRLRRLPPPYLDVFTVHSHRLLSVTRKELDESAKRVFARAGEQQPAHFNENKAELHELLASVRLLLEPVQVPEMRHTGIILEPHVSDTGVQLPVHLANDNDMTLFYPTGTKNANIREYIRDTIHKHLTVSASAPALPTQHGSTTGTATAAAHGDTQPAVKSTGKSTATKKKKFPSRPFAHVSSAIASPSKAQIVDRELNRQAKDIITAIRANSSKINELLGT